MRKLKNLFLLVTFFYKTFVAYMHLCFVSYPVSHNKVVETEGDRGDLVSLAF